MEFCRNSLQKLGYKWVVVVAGGISAGVYPSIMQYIPEKMKHVPFGALIGMVLAVFYKMEKDIARRSKEESDEDELRLMEVLLAVDKQKDEIRKDIENVRKVVSKAVSRVRARRQLLEFDEVTQVKADGESTDDSSKNGAMTNFHSLVIESSLQTDLPRLKLSDVAFMLKEFDLNCAEFVAFVKGNTKLKSVSDLTGCLSSDGSDMQVIRPSDVLAQYKKEVEHLHKTVSELKSTEVSSRNQIAEAPNYNEDNIDF